jgi:hypothetical protein
MTSLDSQQGPIAHSCSVRFMNLRSVYKHISSVTHFDAIQLLLESSRQGRTVALYLRSFDLSAGMGRIVDPTVKISETDPDDVALLSRADREFQQRLAEAVTGPIVGIGALLDSVASRCRRQVRGCCDSASRLRERRCASLMLATVRVRTRSIVGCSHR